VLNFIESRRIVGRRDDTFHVLLGYLVRIVHHAHLGKLLRGHSMRRRADLLRALGLYPRVVG
jgi:hypothetical protein